MQLSTFTEQKLTEVHTVLCQRNYEEIDKETYQILNLLIFISYETCFLQGNFIL